jgi:hypothetical protein
LIDTALLDQDFFFPMSSCQALLPPTQGRGSDWQLFFLRQRPKA